MWLLCEWKTGETQTTKVTCLLCYSEEWVRGRVGMKRAVSARDFMSLRTQVNSGISLDPFTLLHHIQQLRVLIRVIVNVGGSLAISTYRR